MSYKTELIKAIKLIKCINTHIVFIGGIVATPKEEIATELKKEDFNVYKITDLKRAKEYLANTIEGSPHIRIALLGDIHEPQKLLDMIGEYFCTYVYLYPNDKIGYKKLLTEASKNSKFSIPANYGEDIAQLRDMDKLVIKLKELNKIVYNNYLEILDDKLITILI